MEGGGGWRGAVQCCVCDTFIRVLSGSEGPLEVSGNDALWESVVNRFRDRSRGGRLTSVRTKGRTV